FKPRFKAGVTKNTTDEVNPAENTDIAPTTENKTQSEDTPAKPLGFKPRFKAGVTKNTTDEVNPAENTDIAPTTENK
ncbi:hypothetical protein, partial [Sphingobacterium sp. LRF_L2]|uniref:hypothetical protein n=1 Tax=Sphingobacterium sp. LRF_L2 TaxID=3369421 RepID=UPI003F6202AB